MQVQMKDLLPSSGAPADRLKTSSVWQQRHGLLELEVPGELVLGLLQLLPVLDVGLLDVVDLGLHRLQLGKQLQEADTRACLTSKTK